MTQLARVETRVSAMAMTNSPSQRCRDNGIAVQNAWVNCGQVVLNFVGSERCARPAARVICTAGLKTRWRRGPSRPVGEFSRQYLRRFEAQTTRLGGSEHHRRSVAFVASPWQFAPPAGRKMARDVISCWCATR